jgi:prepilin-type N-terminal cleavage/methylation domain-containing protein
MKRKHGFTLLEILLVIGIIAILAGIVILAINPTRQFSNIRNTQRKMNLAEINKALYQYYIDNSGYPSSITTTLTEICDTGATSTGHSLTCTGFVDLSALVPTYLVAIPLDPSGAIITGGAGYKVAFNSSGKVYLAGTQAENGDSIIFGNNAGVTIFISATGGAITYTDADGQNARSSPAYAGGYKLHTFTTDDALIVTAGSDNAQVLVVAGGGGGGGRMGGGGAGGLVYTSAVAVTTGTYSIVIGAGGAGATNSSTRGSSGSNTSFAAIIATGGGGGGSRNSSPANGINGGSGGGGGGGAGTTGGTGTSGQGNNGGNGNGDGTNGGGGGGGGAGAAASNVSTFAPTSGGVGLDYSGIFGTGAGVAGWFAGGGGGGSGSWMNAAGAGGGGGGGTGGISSGGGVNGTINTGGGGGGGGNTVNTGGSGGSGIVIVRYRS